MVGITTITCMDLIRPAGCSDLAPENHAAIVIHELTILHYIYIHVFLNLDLIH